MNDELDDLISVPEAARRAGVARNTMYRAAKSGKVKARKLGRDYFIDAGDLERWRTEVYRPQMAARYPVKKEEDDTDQPQQPEV